LVVVQEADEAADAELQAVHAPELEGRGEILSSLLSALLLLLVGPLFVLAMLGQEC
jgi:hypothetical protein